MEKKQTKDTDVFFFLTQLFYSSGSRQSAQSKMAPHKEDIKMKIYVLLLPFYVSLIKFPGEQG